MKYCTTCGMMLHVSVGKYIRCVTCRNEIEINKKDKYGKRNNRRRNDIGRRTDR
jgi:DNA-directed RNA polymerase subunit M/transcription elongation factor TFIIS